MRRGKTYEQDGALWLKSTDYGDDKDRVMRKSDGSYTYFVPDVAYHITKWERGFTKVVNIQGTDHHGTIARVRAGLQAADVGIPQGYPDYVLHTMVRVMRGGEEVKISKRAGSYVTLRDLIEWTSKDAVRFFLLSRKPDTEYIFDIDLALAQNNDNPVYYVQYAHARICSVLAAWGGEVAIAERRRPVAAGKPAGAVADAAAGAISRDAERRPRRISRRTTSRSTCASWPPPTTATTMPSASWWTTSRCATRAWRWSPPPRRCCTMDWRCWASAPPQNVAPSGRNSSEKQTAWLRHRGHHHRRGAGPGRGPGGGGLRDQGADARSSTRAKAARPNRTRPRSARTANWDPNAPAVRQEPGQAHAARRRCGRAGAPGGDDPRAHAPHRRRPPAGQEPRPIRWAILPPRVRPRPGPIRSSISSRPAPSARPRTPRPSGRSCR